MAYELLYDKGKEFEEEMKVNLGEIFDRALDTKIEVPIISKVGNVEIELKRYENKTKKYDNIYIVRFEMDNLDFIVPISLSEKKDKEFLQETLLITFKEMIRDYWLKDLTKVNCIL